MVWTLNIKSAQHAQRIADALNKIKPGVGKKYMDGYATRRLTESAAVQAIKESKYVRR